MPYCKECGKELEHDAKFCPHCGTRVSIKVLRAPKRPKARSKKIGRKVIARTVIAVIAIVVTAGIIVVLMTAARGPTRWLSGWSYRRPITITERSGSTLTDYQVLVTLDTSSIIAQGKMRTDAGDLRFTASDGTSLPYWIESGVNTSLTKIWVEVPSIPRSSTENIYAYYGNPSASSANSGDETFDFFDDFPGTDLDMNKWAHAETGRYVVGEGTIKVDIPTLRSRAMINSLQSFPINSAVRTLVRKVTTGSDLRGPIKTVGFSDLSGNDAYTHSEFFGESWFTVIVQNDNSGEYYPGDIGGGSSDWYVLECRWYTNGVRSVSYWKSDIHQYTLTHDYVPDSSDHLKVFVSTRTYSTGNNNTGYTEVDWLAVRKCVSADPTANVGPEET